MASRRAPSLLSALARRPHPQLRRSIISSFLAAPRHQLLPVVQSSLVPRRQAHSIPRPPLPPSATASSFSSSPSTEPLVPESPVLPRGSHGDGGDAAALAPHYELTFTCVPCGARSAHRVSKQGYHHGSVLVTCPACRNRHVVSDHLGVFGGGPATLEELVAARGAIVKRGTLGEDGDVEFWEDGSATARGDRMRAEGVRPAPAPVSGPRDAGSAAPGSTFAAGVRGADAPPRESATATEESGGRS